MKYKYKGFILVKKLFPLLFKVVLGVMDGPETSYGSANFVPTW